MIAKLWWALVGFGFRLLYNELAFTYDLVSWVVSFGHWRTWQRVALRYLDAVPGAPVLELAHGTGNLQLDLRARGCRAVGLDLSPQMGRIARRKLARRGWRPALVRASALALPFPDDTFAAIVSTFPTAFIFERATLAEARRVLRPGGRLVIGANARITGTDPLSRLLEFAYRVTGQRGDLPLDAIAQHFEAAGLPAEFVAHQIAGGEVWLLVAVKS
ncbi:MAG: methyltransferase domain-containing protein [Anaerolineae bacterium]|nr:methyltransferase domain-containing protein [Anaerolineae bacterium]